MQIVLFDFMSINMVEAKVERVQLGKTILYTKVLVPPGNMLPGQMLP